MSAAGSVRRDASGAWFFVVDLPSPAGKRRQVRRRGFATKKDAQAELTRLLSDSQRGVFVEPSRLTLGAFLLDDWLPARRSSLRDSTAAVYEELIRRYVLPAIGEVRLQAIDGPTLNRLYGRLLTEVRPTTGRPGLAPKTVRSVHGLLHTAFSDAIRWGRLQRNPCEAADPPRGASPEMKAWSPAELRAFIQSVQSHRWAGVWSLMATTGLRRGEVLGLRWSDVDLDAATATIRSTRIRIGDVVTTSTPKTAAGNRTISLGPVTVTALRGWKRQQAADRLLMGAGWQGKSELVVTRADGSAPHPNGFGNLFTELVKRAGLPMIRLHDLRHSYATAALAAGVPVKVVSQRIGHSDIAITLRVYAHVLPGDDEAAARRADELLG